MTKRLKILQILVYYDFPEIFIAIDEVGTNYLCLLVNTSQGNITYIATAISSKRLSGFINGNIDLRDIYELPEIKEWYYFNKVDDSINAELWQDENIQESFLPEKGFYYHKPLQGEDLILNEVVEKKNAVIHLAISDEKDNC